jgi:hypothetical protein
MESMKQRAISPTFRPESRRIEPVQQKDKLNSDRQHLFDKNNKMLELKSIITPKKRGKLFSKEEFLTYKNSPVKKKGKGGPLGRVTSLQTLLNSR